MSFDVIDNAAYERHCGAPGVGQAGTPERAAWIAWRDEHQKVHSPAGACRGVNDPVYIVERVA